MMTFLIIIVTAAVSLLSFSSRAMIQEYALAPYAVVRRNRWYQLLTSGFLHAGIGHLAMNMITLYFFGPHMEKVLGGGGFIALYLGSIISGGLLTVLFHRRDLTYRSLGASGGVSGVVFGFVLFRPLERLYLFLIPIGIPALLFAVLYVGVSIYGARTRMGRIGHAAHLGGALGGILLTILLYPDVISIFLSHFR